MSSVSSSDSKKNPNSSSLTRRATEWPALRSTGSQEFNRLASPTYPASRLLSHAMSLSCFRPATRSPTSISLIYFRRHFTWRQSPGCAVANETPRLVDRGGICSGHWLGHAMATAPLHVRVYGSVRDSRGRHSHLAAAAFRI